jgi:hypothetical protein
MKSLIVKSLMQILVFLFILALTVSGVWAATANTFVLSDEGAGLITMLSNAGYGSYNLYDLLVAMQQSADPSISTILTDDFLNALASCPANSQIFTIPLNTIIAGSSVAISDDCTVQIHSFADGVFAYNFYNKPGTSTLQSNISGVGNAFFVHSNDPNTPLISFNSPENTTYNVFAIASGSVAINTFILSNEAPGNLITTLVNAGYGDYDLYQLLLAIQQSTDPSVAGIITDAFLASLNGSCPVNSEIFTTQIKDVKYNSPGVSIGISADCTVQTTNIYAFNYYNQPGTSTLLSNISGVGNAYFVHSGMQPLYTDFNTPLTSWTLPGNGTVTYEAFAIAAGSVTQPATVPTMTEWGMIVFMLLAGLGSVYYLRRQKRANR